MCYLRRIGNLGNLAFILSIFLLLLVVNAFIVYGNSYADHLIVVKSLKLPWMQLLAWNTCTQKTLSTLI